MTSQKIDLIISNNMTNVWYNSYRPKNFNEVLGQELVVKVLQNAISTGRVKNGYLLSGSRGVGKTTLARIFANNLNDIENNPNCAIDIFEMDAASNTSVDDVRLLIENASTPPLIGKYKIFIIDEVHMLSKSAMNALLKILEEPPVYLLFIFATTNPEKILPTVMSRLIKLELMDHSEANLIKNLESISSKESMDIDKESLIMIAKKSKGGQRDAINYLQTLNEYGLEKYTSSDTASILGVMPKVLIEALIYATKSKNVSIEFKQKLIQNFNKIQITPIVAINQLLERVLDDHFNSNIENSDLIPVLANYISVDLPVNNMIEVMAYLDYTFKDKVDIPEIKLSEIKEISIKKKANLDSNSTQKPLPDSLPERIINDNKTEETNEEEEFDQEFVIFDETDYELTPETNNVDVIKTDYKVLKESNPIFNNKINQETTSGTKSHTPNDTNDTSYVSTDVKTNVATNDNTNTNISETNIEYKIEAKINNNEQSIEVGYAQPEDVQKNDLIAMNKIIINAAKDKQAPTSVISAAKFLKLVETKEELDLQLSNESYRSMFKTDDIKYLEDRVDSLIGGLPKFNFKYSEVPLVEIKNEQVSYNSNSTKSVNDQQINTTKSGISDDKASSKEPVTNEVVFDKTSSIGDVNSLSTSKIIDKNSNSDEEIKDTKHFYEVYGSLPVGVPDSVKVTKNIPNPIKTKVENEDETDHLEDLFDI